MAVQTMLVQLDSSIRSYQEFYGGLDATLCGYLRVRRVEVGPVLSRLARHGIHEFEYFWLPKDRTDSSI